MRGFQNGTVALTIVPHKTTRKSFPVSQESPEKQREKLWCTQGALTKRGGNRCISTVEAHAGPRTLAAARPWADRTQLHPFRAVSNGSARGPSGRGPFPSRSRQRGGRVTHGLLPLIVRRSPLRSRTFEWRPAEAISRTCSTTLMPAAEKGQDRGKNAAQNGTTSASARRHSKMAPRRGPRAAVYRRPRSALTPP